MASPALSPSASAASPVRWSLYVGAYALLCAAGLLLAISQVASVVAHVLVMPSDSPLWLAAPVPVFGGIVWWALVERPARHTYFAGTAAGLVTALLTIVFWVLVGGLVWGPEGVLAGWPLIVIVVIPAVPAGLVAGLPAMYARRRLSDR